MNIVDKLGITEKEAKSIWDIWAGQWHNCELEFDQVWYGYSELKDQTNIPVKKLKAFMKIMREKGLAYHGPCVNSENIPCGSGNFLATGLEDKSWSEIKELIK